MASTVRFLTVPQLCWATTFQHLRFLFRFVLGTYIPVMCIVVFFGGEITLVEIVLIGTAATTLTAAFMLIIQLRQLMRTPRTQWRMELVAMARMMRDANRQVRLRVLAREAHYVVNDAWVCLRSVLLARPHCFLA